MRNLLLYFLFVTSLAQAQHTNPDFDLMQFNSDFEENFFHNLDEATDLDILLGIGELAAPDDVKVVREKLDGLIATLRGQKFESQSPKRQAAMLEKLLHGKKKLLKQYQLVSPFYHIFYDGEFNCVSSSALYAVLLDEFDVPYSIIELPTHVYVVMYPKEDRIKVETTAPKKGFYAKSDREVKRTMKGLIDFRMVSKEWVKDIGYREAYNRYFFKPKGITLRQLAALQYYNESLVNAADDELELALSEITKSYFIYKNGLTSKVKTELFEEKLKDLSFTNIGRFKYLKEYANTGQASKEVVEKKYLEFLKEFLIERDSVSYVDESHAYLMSTLTNEEMKDKISETYYFGFTEYYDNKEDFVEADRCALRCLRYNVRNKVIKTRAADAIHADLVELNFYEKLTEMEDATVESDSLMLLKEKEIYLSWIPEIQKTKYEEVIDFYIYYSIGMQAIESDDHVTGLYYLKKVLETYKAIKDKDMINEDVIPNIFLKIGDHYYYSKGDAESALKFIDQGLKIFRKNKDLKAKKKLFEAQTDED